MTFSSVSVLANQYFNVENSSISEFTDNLRQNAYTVFEENCLLHGDNLSLSAVPRRVHGRTPLDDLALLLFS